MKRIYYLVILLIAINFCTQSMFSQNLNQHYYQDLWWVNLGVGAGSMNSDFSYEISFNYYLDNAHLISGRFAGIQQYTLVSLGGESTNENIYDLGLLYGRLIKSDFGYFSLSGGIGYVGGRKYTKATSIYGTEYLEERISNIGLPFEAQLFFTPSDHFGLGFYGFSNFNLEKNFFCFGFTIQYGELR